MYLPIAIFYGIGLFVFGGIGLFLVHIPLLIWQHFKQNDNEHKYLPTAPAVMVFLIGIVCLANCIGKYQTNQSFARLSFIGNILWTVPNSFLSHYESGAPQEVLAKMIEGQLDYIWAYKTAWLFAILPIIWIVTFLEIAIAALVVAPVLTLLSVAVSVFIIWQTKAYDLLEFPSALIGYPDLIQGKEDEFAFRKLEAALAKFRHDGEDAKDAYALRRVDYCGPHIAEDIAKEISTKKNLITITTDSYVMYPEEVLKSLREMTRENYLRAVRQDDIKYREIISEYKKTTPIQKILLNVFTALFTIVCIFFALAFLVTGAVSLFAGLAVLYIIILLKVLKPAIARHTPTSTAEDVKLVTKVLNLDLSPYDEYDVLNDKHGNFNIRTLYNYIVRYNELLFYPEWLRYKESEHYYKAFFDPIAFVEYSFVRTVNKDESTGRVVDGTEVDKYVYPYRIVRYGDESHMKIDRVNHVIYFY